MNAHAQRRSGDPGAPGGGAVLPLLVNRTPTAGQTYFAASVLVLCLALALATLPYATRPWPPIWAFIPAYQAVLVGAALITALLLLAQVPVLGSPALIVLGCGYVFSAVMGVAHMLSFPGLFGHAGLLGGSGQETAWLYFFWHGGFALFVAGYALLPRHAGVPEARRFVGGWIALALVLTLALCVGLIALSASAALPALMLGNADGSHKRTVALWTWALGLMALVLLLWRRRSASLLDVWLQVVMLVWVCDTALAAVFNGARFDVGWYMGRVYGLFGEGVLLAMLLVEDSRNYSRLAALHARELERTDKALRISQARLETTFDNAAVGIAMALPDGTWVRVNRRMCAITGYTAEELCSMRVGGLQHPDDPQSVHDGLPGLLRGEHEHFSGEQRLVRKDGSTALVQVAASMTRLPDGKPDSLIVVVEDIQARWDAQQALLQSEQRFRSVFERVTASIYILDCNDGSIVDANRHAIAAHGFDSLEAFQAGHAWLEPPYSAADALAQVYAASAQGELRFEWLSRHRLGHEFWQDVSMCPVQVNGVQRVLAIATDITARKALEQGMIEASTAEQERIGREIHDGLGQQLTGLSMLAKNLTRRLEQSGARAEAATAQLMEEHLHAALTEARNLARGLAPVDIDAQGLPHALRALAERVSQSGGAVAGVYEGLEQLDLGDQTHATHLYRIAQEGVQNALRHADARRIVLSLRLQRGGLVLEVSDDGRGMPTTYQEGSGMGLRTMVYRAGILRARLGVAPRPGGGTRLRCELPLGAMSAELPDLSAA